MMVDDHIQDKVCIQCDDDVHFFYFRLEIPFFDKFDPKYQNRLTFGS